MQPVPQAGFFGDLVFQTAFGAALFERMRITAGGRVGIGNTNPTFLLDISSTTNSEGISITAPNAQVTIRDPSVASTLQFYMNSSTQGLYTINTLPVYFYQNGGARLVISNANVGIGTTSPAYALDVNGSARITGGLIFSVQSI
jgi:hypothetical protein